MTGFWNVPADIPSVEQSLVQLNALLKENRRTLEASDGDDADLYRKEASTRITHIEHLIPVMERLLRFRRELRDLYAAVCVAVTTSDPEVAPI